MDDDTRGYVSDLIRTAEGHYRRAIALLHEAARIAGGEARDAPGSPDYVPLPSPVVPKLGWRTPGTQPLSGKEARTDEPVRASPLHSE